MYIYSFTPLWFGQEIKLESRPIDPRSLFRGNFVRLNYNFNTLRKDNCDNFSSCNTGDYIYASLELNDQGLYRFKKASKRKPISGVFIRGTIQRANSYNIKASYGIEAFFLPKKEALALEKKMRRGGIIVLAVMKSGRATIKSIEAKENAN